MGPEARSAEGSLEKRATLPATSSRGPRGRMASTGGNSAAKKQASAATGKQATASSPKKPTGAARELEQCRTQLALVNVVQHGLGSGLDFPSIVDRVADMLRVALRTQDLTITWYDEQANLVH